MSKKKKEIKMVKCSECEDFCYYGGSGGVCHACGGAISWNPNEEIECPFKIEERGGEMVT